MNKIILGFTGLIASGKGTAAQYYAKKYNAPVYRFSTPLRDLLKRIYLEESRDYLVKMSECIRATFGQDILASTIAKDAAANTNHLVIVEGVRRIPDIEYLKKLPNFVLVEIFADQKIRYQRLIKRAENSDDVTKTYDQFLADHKRSTEITIPEIAEMATERIDNNGSLDDLCRQLENLLHKYQNQ